MLVAVSCSKDEQSESQTSAVKEQRAGQIVSPTGFVIAESTLELQRELFGSATNVIITNINFLDHTIVTGASAVISYTQGGVSKKLGYAAGIINAGPSAPTANTINKFSLTSNFDYKVYSCSGSGCCYVSGTVTSSGASSFTCLCEGGSGSCSMTDTIVITRKK